MMAEEITISENEEKEFREFLLTRIREYNNEKSAYHRESRQPGRVIPLNLIVKDQAGEYIGGLLANIFWNWLEIEYLYIPQELRGKGIGTQLLQKAERIAISRGCMSCFLTTFAFQARIFYEKHGFTVVGRLENYPPGSAYFWMRKDFSEGIGSGKQP
jgi:GNAT superfamily N-acetyltransferase